MIYAHVLLTIFTAQMKLLHTKRGFLLLLLKLRSHANERPYVIFNRKHIFVTVYDLIGYITCIEVNFLILLYMSFIFYYLLL